MAAPVPAPAPASAPEPAVPQPAEPEPAIAIEPPPPRAYASFDLTAAASSEPRTCQLAKAARSLLELGAFEAALIAASACVEEAGGGDAGTKGVSLARSVIARAGYELAYASYSEAYVHIYETHPPKAEEAQRACEEARALSTDAAGACDRQLGDELLLEKYRDELQRYCDHRERSVELGRRAQALAAAARRAAKDAADEAQGGAGAGGDGGGTVGGIGADHGAIAARAQAHAEFAAARAREAERARERAAARADEMVARLASLEAEVEAREARMRREAAEAEAMRAALSASELEQSAPPPRDEREGGADDELRRARARTLPDALRDGKWARLAGKNHQRFHRWVRLVDGSCVQQHATLACTPSDWRASLNALAELRRKDADVLEAYGDAEPASADQRFRARFHELQEARKAAEARVLVVESEINALVDEISAE